MPTLIASGLEQRVNQMLIDFRPSLYSLAELYSDCDAVAQSAVGTKAWPVAAAHVDLLLSHCRITHRLVSNDYARTLLLSFIHHS